MGASGSCRTMRPINTVDSVLLAAVSGRVIKRCFTSTTRKPFYCGGNVHFSILGNPLYIYIRVLSFGLPIYVFIVKIEISSIEFAFLKLEL